MADEQENMAAKPSAEAPPAPAAEQPQPPKKDADSAYPFSVTVGHVYDGPLDLLLDLIRKQDIDIYDIPIAKITAQFLAYVEQLKATDVDAAGDFFLHRRAAHSHQEPDAAAALSRRGRRRRSGGP